MADQTEVEADMAVVTAAGSRTHFNRDKPGQFAIVPDGYKLESLEALQAVPNRHSADHVFVTVASLAEYLNKFATADTMISASSAKEQITAVLDGDAPSVPAFKEHKASFKATRSDVLNAWLGACGRGLSQVDFGSFLEDRAGDVVQPDAASVMEMVMTFDATKRVTFKSATRLQDGNRQFQYVEENEARGGVTLPDHFIILAPVFDGMEPQRIKFMVRYRIDDGRLVFTVHMHDRATVLREAFNRCIDALTVSLKTPLPIYRTP